MRCGEAIGGYEGYSYINEGMNVLNGLQYNQSIKGDGFSQTVYVYEDMHISTQNPQTISSLPDRSYI